MHAHTTAITSTKLAYVGAGTPAHDSTVSTAACLLNMHTSCTAQALEDDAAATQKKMDSANALLTALAGEEVRWTAQSKEFDLTIQRLTGDCAMASAFVSYLGPFNREFRELLMNRDFYNDCVKLKIPVTPDMQVRVFCVCVSVCVVRLAKLTPAMCRAWARMRACSCVCCVHLCASPIQDTLECRLTHTTTWLSTPFHATLSTQACPHSSPHHPRASAPPTLSLHTQVANLLVDPCPHTCTPPTLSLHAQVANFLVDDAEVGEWTLQGLPTDELSIQNGIMVTRASRYPVLVDPQGQGRIWIMNREEANQLKVTQLNDRMFRNSLEDCLSFGKPLLIENIEEVRVCGQFYSLGKRL